MNPVLIALQKMVFRPASNHWKSIKKKPASQGGL
jgi:hypothetical protein